MKDAPHPFAAALAYDWILSKQGQAVYKDAGPDGAAQGYGLSRQRRRVKAKSIISLSAASWQTRRDSTRSSTTSTSEVSAGDGATWPGPTPWLGSAACAVGRSRGSVPLSCSRASSRRAGSGPIEVRNRIVQMAHGARLIEHLLAPGGPGFWGDDVRRVSRGARAGRRRSPHHRAGQRPPGSRTRWSRTCRASTLGCCRRTGW